MPYFPWNNDNLRRYGRAWSRANPAMLWWHTGVKTFETMLAAPEVIAQRTARMAAAGPFPGMHDQRELLAMGTEKVSAFSRSWFGAAREMVSFQQQMANVAGRQWWTLLNAFNPLLMGRSGRAFAMPFSAMTGLIAAGNHAMSALPRVAHSAVSPVHAKATSNAKRLRRRT